MGDPAVAQGDRDSSPVVVMPHEFRCPISGDLMEDPVISQDDRSYERELIERWFEHAACARAPMP